MTPSPSPAARLLILCVRGYRATLSPFLGGHCRFCPTCSVYAIECLTNRGAVVGSWLTLRRLLRCHPLGGSGYDPPPGPPRSADHTSHHDPSDLANPEGSAGRK